MGRRKTLNPTIWFQYACWCIQSWMYTHQPYYPLRLRVWLHGRYDKERIHVTTFDVEIWEEFGHTDYPKPLPWYIGPSLRGPFVVPWLKIANFIRSLTDGRSHRCEFTDSKRGALYGNKEGAFMDRYFEQFLVNISGDMDVIDWLEDGLETRKN